MPAFSECSDKQCRLSKQLSSHSLITLSHVVSPSLAPTQALLWSLSHVPAAFLPPTPLLVSPSLTHRCFKYSPELLMLSVPWWLLIQRPLWVCYLYVLFFICLGYQIQEIIHCRPKLSAIVFKTGSEPIGTVRFVALYRSIDPYVFAQRKDLHNRPEVWKQTCFSRDKER